MLLGEADDGGRSTFLRDAATVEAVPARPETQRIDVLADPRRRLILGKLRFATGGMTKDEVGAAVGISRTLAAFHLEKLLKAGLVSADFRSSGEGNRPGRPAKLYRASGAEVAITVPERRYQVVAEILSAAVVDAAVSGASPVERASAIAHQKGHELGKQLAHEAAPGRKRPATRPGGVLRLLEELGYEPHLDSGEIALRNCPFASLVTDPYLVCALNHRLLQGAVEGCGADKLEVEMDPDHPIGHCCVVVRPRLVP